MSNCTFYSDGKSVVRWFINHMKDPNAHKKDRVVVVIIDFEMGGLNGLEAVKEVRALYRVINEQYRKKESSMV